MTDAQRIDGDDMTWDWWQALGEAGYFTVEPGGGISYNKNAMPQTQTLYGTMHNGDVAGLSLVDVPQSYVVQTHAQRTDNALWHLSLRIAELNTEVQELRRQLADMTADS